jgi:hypothetical protein
MNTNRQAAILVGIMFILASATAILGFLLYQPILYDVPHCQDSKMTFLSVD